MLGAGGSTKKALLLALLLGAENPVDLALAERPPSVTARNGSLEGRLSGVGLGGGGREGALRESGTSPSLALTPSEIRELSLSGFIGATRNCNKLRSKHHKASPTQEPSSLLA